MSAIETDPSGHISILSQHRASDGELAILSERQRHLRETTVPVLRRGRDVVGYVSEVILKMFYAWPTIRLDEEKATGVVQAYVEQVLNLPLWAIEAGVADCQGRKDAFPPSAGVFRAACEAKMSSVQDELAELGKVLSAEPYTPTPHGEESKRRVKELAKSLRAAVDGTPLLASDYRKNPDAEAVRQIEEFHVRRAAPVDHSKAVSISDDFRLQEMAREVGNEWRG